MCAFFWAPATKSTTASTASAAQDGAHEDTPGPADVHVDPGAAQGRDAGSPGAALSRVICVAGRLTSQNRSADRSGAAGPSSRPVAGPSSSSHVGNTGVTVRKLPACILRGGRANRLPWVWRTRCCVTPVHGSRCAGCVDRYERSTRAVHCRRQQYPVPYPSWLNTGDNTWQITAATFVGLMSLPGLAVLYASIVPKKWAVNVLAMMFAGFSLVLIAWVLWSYKMGFGATSLGGGVHNGIQTAAHAASGGSNTSSRTSSGNRARSPTASANRARRCRRPTPSFPSTSRPTSLAYFQFVFAAITPLLFMGSVLGRIKFSAWCLLVPLWSTFVYGDRRLLAVGRRLLRPGGLARLLRWLRHPYVRRSLGLRRRLGARAPAASRSPARLTQQPGHGGGRGRHPVARLERLQRW